ncbi:MAG: class I tRNA ligase family protein [Candidatus Adlerbacteria bacterium]
MDDLKQGGEELHPEAVHKPKSTFAVREEKTLAFWEAQDIFKKSLEKHAPKGEFVFYDGPPFANGLPHYGHLLQSTIKDAIPRYRTMRGYRVPRRWGWDCHGLPVENLVEKELGFKSKRDIEEFGIANFNKAARTSIMKDVADWKRIIPRIGRWADMENDYKTMDSTYTESVWWAFKNLHSRGLIYEGFKGMHFCPRCGTTLSNNEVAQGYMDIEDIAVTVKFPLVDEPETSILIWTTTPWTLPGNTAAAVNADAVYVKVRTDEGFVVVAKELMTKVLGEDAKIFAEILGKDLVGKRYKPPFSYFEHTLHKHKSHAYKIYAAPYVTLEDGTGIVHLAPAYGAEDLIFAQKEKIPLIQHVTDEGKFIATVTDFVGLSVKPKGRHMETDAKIVENLHARGLLFHQEKITHSYPHCWRCDTPLLNWAANSWFVSVSKIKPKLLAQNKKVSWVPKSTGEGRFQKGLESAPDWAISRSRYWGAPLPVWRHSKTKELKVMGSVEELLQVVRRSGNKYFVMRHGEAQSNVDNVEDIEGDPNNHLTKKGKAQVLSAARALASKKIDMIVTSPFVRTKETAHLLANEFGLPESAVMVDTRLGEVAHVTPELCRNVGEFIFEIERRYSGKNILVVSHGGAIWALQQVVGRQPTTGFYRTAMLGNAECAELPFVPFPHNEQYELDLHRPFIDDILLGDSLAGEWKRAPDVFDCWFESGSMPYGSNHYPFQKNNFNPKKMFGLMPKGYPADFIAEAVDQTRGWFYSLIVLGTALFGRSPYKNVITTGLINASDGKKMSKRLKNYPDPLDLIDKYGVDSLRYYILSSQLVRGEDLSFKEQGVEEVSKKLLMRLDNVVSFYELYANSTTRSNESTHALDRWILSRFGELTTQTTAGFESYELDAATRPLALFIDDLSTWYLRRSRDRFKTDGEGKVQALATLRFVLHTLAHTMAPVMPFFADELFGRMKEEGDPESVHLSGWPAAEKVDTALLADMVRVREVASKGLELRESAGIKIRQPLAALVAKQLPNDDGLRALIKDELNVKKVVEDVAQVNDVSLDTELTPELKEEGVVRDLARRIQEWRKEQKLTIADRPVCTLLVSAEEKIVAEKNKTALMAQTGLEDLQLVVK